MLDGLAMAETTPGPLIMVVQDYFAAVVALITFAGFWKWNWPIHWVVATGGVAGVVLRMAK